jgi:hypothetical protein
MSLIKLAGMGENVNALRKQFLRFKAGEKDFGVLNQMMQIKNTANRAIKNKNNPDAYATHMLQLNKLTNKVKSNKYAKERMEDFKTFTRVGRDIHENPNLIKTESDLNRLFKKHS